jgi:hypothetical protein
VLPTLALKPWCRSEGTRICRHRWNQDFNIIIIPISICACESWTLKIDDQRHLDAFETNSLRRIAGITYLDRISNIRLFGSLNIKHTILQKIKLPQLTWLGDIQRTENSRLPKIVFHGHLHGSRPRGRPPKRRKYNFSTLNLPLLLRLT